MEIKFNILEGFEWAPGPHPATDDLPPWWKEMKNYVPQEEPTDQVPTGTVKICSPFESALGAGYMLPLPFAVSVTCDKKGATTMRWNSPVGMDTWNVIGAHSNEQIPEANMGLEEGTPFKFQLPYSVSLPEGYRALYTHPLNRYDLPFSSFSGILDAGYDSPVNIPFLWLSEDSTCFIDAGTPICQVIPFKLDEWEHSSSSLPMSALMEDSRVATGFVHGYRRKFAKKQVWR
jgi:hypothetical protein